MVAIYLLISIISIYFYLFIKKIKEDKRFNLPAPPRYPFIGNAYVLFGKPEKIFFKVSKLIKNSKRLTALWIGPYLNVLLYDPDDIEIILKSSKNMKKTYHYTFMKMWLGDCILLSNGSKFRQHKKILISSFNLSNLKMYVGIVNKHTENMVEKLRSKVGCSEFNIHSYLSLCTLNAFLENTLALEKELADEEVKIYVDAVEKAGLYAHIRSCKIWLYPDFIFKFSKLKKMQDKSINILNELTKKVILKRRQISELRKSCPELKDQYRTTFIDYFFDTTKENGEQFTEEEIRDEVMVMLFAGQDTTTSTLGFILSVLGIYKDVQDKILYEIHEVIDLQKPITFEDLLNLRYMEQVIYETLRLFPPFAAIGKTPLEDIKLDNCIIPKGCAVGIAIMQLHRNPNIYPEPNKFNPDNFLPEKVKERHPCSFIPFSSGYRACIGTKYAMQVIKIVLLRILTNFEIHCDRNLKEFRLASEVTLRRKEGFLVSLRSRSSTK